ncbi:MAG: TolC family protein [Calditrichaeota bacterium]|nr:TolC family protein [Calditrichota bacterium]
MRKEHVFFIFILLFSGVLWGSAVPAQVPQQLTLRRCLKAVLARHPSVFAYRKVEEQKAAESRRLRAETRPQLDYALTTGAYHYSPYHYRILENTVVLTWNLDKWLGKLSEIGMTEESIAKIRARQNRLRLAFEVKQAFYRLTQARQERRIAQMSKAYLQHHLEISRGLFRLGQIDQLDLYRTQANLSASEEAVAAAENDCRQWQIQLQNLTGLTISERDSLVLPVSRWTPADISPDSLLAAAKRGNPALAVLDEQIQQTQIRERLVRASRFPTAALSGGFVFDNDPTSGGNYAVVQLGLQLPLVDWHQRKNQAQAFRLHRESLEETRKTLLLDIRTQIEKLLAQLGYLENLETLKARTLLQARKAFFLTENSYQAGVASNTDVLLAQKEWIQTRLAQEEVRLQMRVVQAELDLLIGRMGVHQ